MSSGRVSLDFGARGGVRVLGTPELKARLDAVSLVFKPLGRKWADTATEIAKAKVPYKTGKLRNSIRVREASKRRAVVGAYYTAYFIDAGARYPSVRRRKDSGPRNTIFQKKGFRMKPRPFRAFAVWESLRRHPMAESLINEWNRAADGP